MQSSSGNDFLDYDAAFFRGGLPTRFRTHDNYENELDLNLTLSDIEDFDEPMPFMFQLDERPNDIDEPNSCCHKDCSDRDGDANESTFISYLPEADHSIELSPFDQTFENMDADLNESNLNSTKILPIVGARSRLISDPVFNDRLEQSKPPIEALQPID